MRHFIKDNRLVLENVININNKLDNHDKKTKNKKCNWKLIVLKYLEGYNETRKGGKSNEIWR